MKSNQYTCSSDISRMAHCWNKCSNVGIENDVCKIPNTLEYCIKTERQVNYNPILGQIRHWDRCIYIYIYIIYVYIYTYINMYIIYICKYTYI